ncbi:PTS sugar transporter subunit IIB [Melghirimyces algeriensis]|uniref:PTS system, cellobiose-specific IIB component n=1 Tax=Melghirimyces algeriensis TaxID=910412 RepID=A0A521E3S9_9BACL|nr:PTS sugar transporter subunit IIB [Melghirimyces algeriensis]SMO77810.1 PTS system, cellobiose-specific IIB component [Melghirimyces algeriensis]
MKKPLRVLIICGLGGTSHLLAKKVKEAAQRRNISFDVEAGSILDFRNRLTQFEVLLLEPQVRHMKKELQSVAKRDGIALGAVDPRSFATMDGDAVLDQILHLLKADLEINQG